MAILSGFQRMVLGYTEPKCSASASAEVQDLERFRCRLHLARSVKAYAAADAQGRQQFKSPYRRVSWPLFSWVVLKMSVDRPTFVVAGSIVSIITYFAIAARAVYKLAH